MFLQTLWARFGKQVIKFGIIGGASIVFGSVVLFSLTEYAHIWYVYSNWASAILGQLFAFLGYKYYAFTIDNGRAAYSFGKQFVIHWAVWGVGLAISTGVIYSLTTYGHVWYMFSSFAATALSGSSNFFSHHYYTYKPASFSCEKGLKKI